MFYTKFIKDEFIRLWEIVNPIAAEVKEIKKILDSHKLYKTSSFSPTASLESIHHMKIEDRLDKLERDYRKTINDCMNGDCPHNNADSLTNCNADPFECRKYKKAKD